MCGIMILIENKIIEINKFPDGTLLLKEDISDNFKDFDKLTIKWFFENNEELVALIFLVKHIKSHGIKDIDLFMPYIPNARQDRVKNNEDVFTLKYFAEIINLLDFNSVSSLDPHSSVSEALINNMNIISPKKYIVQAIDEISDKDLIVFYPDEGAMKRYSNMLDMPYCFGIKNRDWKTGEIKDLSVVGELDLIKSSNVLIVDDISSRGGTFYHSACKLKELGANDLYLYISHCENTILKGDVLKDDLFKKVFTTNSIFTESHDLIEVFNL